jgi:hypothetical protein
MANPSLHWQSHSSMVVGVSGPMKGAIIFKAIVICQGVVQKAGREGGAEGGYWTPLLMNCLVSLLSGVVWEVPVGQKIGGGMQ